MTADNLHLGPDAQVNHAITLLRAPQSQVRFSHRMDIVPGVFVSIDTEGMLNGGISIGGEGLMSLAYDVQKTPRWLAVHFVVGGVDLSKAAIVGVVCKSRAPEAATFRVCLRSGTAQGYQDAFLPKHVVAFSQESVHVDLLKLHGLDTVPEQAPWRELILFFQTTSAEIDLLDLRIFIV